MKLFEKNVGTAGRVVRVAAALGITWYAGAYVARPLSYLLLPAGLVIDLTGIFGTCTIYSMLGMNTAEKPAKQAKKRK